MNNQNNNEINGVNNNSELNPINLGSLNQMPTSEVTTQVTPLINAVPTQNVVIVPETNIVSPEVQMATPVVNPTSVETISPISDLSPLSSVQGVVDSPVVAPDMQVSNLVINSIPVEETAPITGVQGLNQENTNVMFSDIPKIDNDPIEDLLLDANPQIVLPEKESVGAIPPNKKEKKPMNKMLFIVIILFLITAVSYGIYFLLTISETEGKVNFESIIISVGESLPTDINEYASFENVDSVNCTYNTSGVNTSSAGIYTYTITCEGITYDSTITVIDEREFTVEFTDVVAFKNSELSPEDFIVSSSKDDAIYEFKDAAAVEESLASTGGPYDVVIVAKDNSGNELNLTTSYYVIYAYYDATSDEMESKNFDVTYTITDRFYINEETMYMGISYRTYLYSFEQSEYLTIKESYSESDTFDEIVGKLTFDDATNTVAVTVALTSVTLNIEYEDNFPEDYTSINAYYRTKGYKINIIQNKD